MILFEIVVPEPVLEQGVENHRFRILADKSQNLLLHQSVLQAAHIGGRVEGIFPDHLSRAELRIAVDDRLQQAHLEGGEVVHHRDEAASV